MKVIVCHPGTQHAGKLAAALRKEDLLASFYTGWRLNPDSMLGRRLHLSGLRALDASLTGCTVQIRSPEFFARVARGLGSGGERLMRLRNAWFQRLIPQRAITSSDAVIGFDTSSWLLSSRAKELGKPFVLDRTAIHRTTRATIRRGLETAGQQAAPLAIPPHDIQDDLESAELTHASRVVVASHFAKHSLTDAGIAAGKIAILPYGVNSGWFAAGASRAGVTGNAIFLYVGNLRTDKGLDVLLDAWKQVDATAAELWLVGEGEPAVIQSARGMPGVRLLGKLAPEKLRATYQNATAFVFPTYYDGFGMVLLEAMACGLPIIATPHCAAPELVQDGAAGRICPVGDSTALAAAMADVCTQRASWEQRGSAACAIAKAYSWETYGTRWAALLREVVA